MPYSGIADLVTTPFCVAYTFKRTPSIFRSIGDDSKKSRACLFTRRRAGGHSQNGYSESVSCVAARRCDTLRILSRGCYIMQKRNWHLSWSWAIAPAVEKAG